MQVYLAGNYIFSLTWCNLFKICFSQLGVGQGTQRGKAAFGHNNTKHDDFDLGKRWVWNLEFENRNQVGTENSAFPQHHGGKSLYSSKILYSKQCWTSVIWNSAWREVGDGYFLPRHCFDECLCSALTINIYRVFSRAYHPLIYVKCFIRQMPFLPEWTVGEGADWWRGHLSIHFVSVCLMITQGQRQNDSL